MLEIVPDNAITSARDEKELTRPAMMRCVDTRTPDVPNMILIRVQSLTI